MKLEVLEQAEQKHTNAHNGKIILVTGATGALGSEVAMALAQAGATVILHGKTIAKLELLYDRIEQAGLPQPAIYPLSFSGATLKDYEEMAEAIASNFGRLDGIVHCSGILGALAPTENTDPATWAQVMQVNLNGPYALFRSCLPLLKKSHGRLLVTVDDKHEAYWGAYGISTAALATATEIIGHEMAGNGLALAIHVPPFQSPLRARAYPGEDGSRLLQASQLAPAFAYLMSETPDGIKGYRISIAPSAEENA